MARKTKAQQAQDAVNLLALSTQIELRKAAAALEEQAAALRAYDDMIAAESNGNGDFDPEAKSLDARALLTLINRVQRPDSLNAALVWATRIESHTVDIHKG